MERDHNTPDQQRTAENDVRPQSDESARHAQNPADQGQNYDPNLENKRWVHAYQHMTLGERFGFWTLAATAALAIATFVLALATADMARSTRTLADFAAKQAQDTQTALATSDRQAKAAEEANRIAQEPSLSISNVSLPAPQIGQEFVGTYGVFDSGHTAAFNVRIQSSLIILPLGQLPTPLSANSTIGGAILYPAVGAASTGLSTEAKISADTMTMSKISGIKNGTQFAYFLMRVDYSDAQRKEHHISNCNLFISSMPKLTPCATGNELD